MSQPAGESRESGRRNFLKTSAAVAAGAALTQMAIASRAHAAGTDEIRVGLIGCGGRGRGAAVNVSQSSPNVKIAALADAFPDRMAECKKELDKNKVAVPAAEFCFTGLNAYEKLLAMADINYVILATPPGFRSGHILAAVKAGKNIFAEKPVAVDGVGVRKCLEAYKLAGEKNLGIGAGTQRRHQTGYLETIKRIHDGAIGDILAARCYWNQGGLWVKEKDAKMSDAEWQVRNWLYFTWLSGDHICEQHVHNLDVINWCMKGHPVKASGMGGRQVRTDPKYGHIFDHFAIEYEYAGGAHLLSECRQIEGCDGRIGEVVVGTKGKSDPGNWIEGENKFKNTIKQELSPYVQEHKDLIESIRAGKPLNELQNVAESTLTAIMGRMSAYTGKSVTWDQALNSKQDLMPADLSLDMSLPIPPVAVPGQTKLA